jgi:transcriptional regulator with XRE-family HTH domain
MEGSVPATGPGFAVTLRRVRARAGLSQEELADRAGLSVRGLRYLERGVRHPYRSTVERLSAALALESEASAALVASATASQGRLRFRNLTRSACRDPPGHWWAGNRSWVKPCSCCGATRFDS